MREVPIPNFVSGIRQRLPFAAIKLTGKVAVQVRDGLTLAAIRVQLIQLRPNQGVIVRQSPRAAAVEIQIRAHGGAADAIGVPAPSWRTGLPLSGAAACRQQSNAHRQNQHWKEFTHGDYPRYDARVDLHTSLLIAATLRIISTDRREFLCLTGFSPALAARGFRARWAGQSAGSAGREASARWRSHGDTSGCRGAAHRRLLAWRSTARCSETARPPIAV